MFVYKCPPIQGDWDTSEWAEELCDTPSCYDYQLTKIRTCECSDEQGLHEDVNQCRGSPLIAVGYWSILAQGLGTIHNIYFSLIRLKSSKE